MRRALALGSAVTMMLAGAPTTGSARPSTVGLDSGVLAVRSAVQLVAARTPALKASPDDAFVRHTTAASPDGLRYVPYERTHKGLPVYGGDFVIVTSPTGRVLSTSVQQRSVIDLPTITPRISATRAAGIARPAQQRPGAVASTRLVVFALDSAPRLAWESVVLGQQGGVPSRLHVFVDATTGAVLHRYDNVHKGTGHAAINGGTVSIDTSRSGNSFSMTDPIRPGITCRDYNNDKVFVGPDDVWGDGNGARIETGCVDALYSAQRHWGMLRDWLGRHGIDGRGRGFPIRMGADFVNAFWDGSSVGFGHNSAGKWLSSLDVVGHEYGHGIDELTPGGIAANGVDEATPDILATLTEWYADNTAFDPPDFTIGEENDFNGDGKPVRYMYKPSLAGHRDCYSSSIPRDDPYAASGPLNHWFYLLARGTSGGGDGQPSSPTCNGSTITGVGVRAAGQIFYNAMLSKTTSMTYPRYRTATLQAAKNLSPGDCGKFDTVKAAWNAVSVPAQPTDPTCGT